MTNIDILAFIRFFYRGGWPGQRLGQAFLNSTGKECPNHGVDGHPCLFYETSEKEALSVIWKNFGND